MSKKLILVVDDEVEFSAIMKQKIESWGFDVICDSSGSDAINSIKTKNPNLVILDYMMPDKDGVATLTDIRSFNKDIPVIMFTAHPDEHSFKSAEGLKVSAFIPKLSVYSDAQSALKTALDLAFKKADSSL